MEKTAMPTIGTRHLVAGSRSIFVIGMTFLLAACVSINTGQGATNSQQSQQAPQKKDESYTEKKISLDEAASFNMTLGAQYIKQNNLPQAIAKLKKAVAQQPNLVLAHTYLGFAYAQNGEIVKAKKHYTQAIKLEPTDPVSLNNYGTFLCQNNEERASLAFFEKAAGNRTYQTPDAAYANAGVCARKIPDLIASEKYFRQAIGANPRYSEAYYYLADINLEHDNVEIASGHFKNLAILTNVTEKPDYLWLGYRTEKALGNYDKAGEYSLLLQKKFPTSKQTKLLLER